MVGVDESPQSWFTLRWASEQAERTGARIQVIAVWATPAVVGAAPDIGAGALSVPPMTDPLITGASLRNAAEQRLSAALTSLPPGADDRIDPLVLEGDAATVLVDAAEDADLLVLGNAGRGALAGAVVGSVALRCAHRARCPVVLVPDPAAVSSA